MEPGLFPRERASAETARWRAAAITSVGGVPLGAEALATPGLRTRLPSGLKSGYITGGVGRFSSMARNATVFSPASSF